MNFHSQTVKKLGLTKVNTTPSAQGLRAYYSIVGVVALNKVVEELHQK